MTFFKTSWLLSKNSKRRSGFWKSRSRLKRARSWCACRKFPQIRRSWCKNPRMPKLAWWTGSTQMQTKKRRLIRCESILPSPVRTPPRFSQHSDQSPSEASPVSARREKATISPLSSLWYPRNRRCCSEMKKWVTYSTRMRRGAERASNRERKQTVLPSYRSITWRSIRTAYMPRLARSSSSSTLQSPWLYRITTKSSSITWRYSKYSSAWIISRSA